jgi:hypothetical protein
MTKHTPGPWVVGDDLGASHDTVWSGRDDSMICSAAFHGREMTAANARLIAAAPDLLAVAEVIHGALMRATTICGKMTIKDLVEEVGPALEKAIAKAEGRE